MTDQERALDDLRDYLDTIPVDESKDSVDLSRSMTIVCPDCGKQIEFRGKCPVCGGDQWIPAGKVKSNDAHEPEPEPEQTNNGEDER